MQQKHYTGLTPEQVEESRRLNGANMLTPPQKDPLWKQFLQKFSDPLIIILLVAGVLSIGISFYEYYLHPDLAVFFEPAGIFVAILLATGLAFYFEMQADKEFSVLNQVNDDEPVEVIRGGIVTEVPRRDIVVGDIIVLNIGEEVPADCELLEATNLFVDESKLTGEPLCQKSAAEADMDPEATYPTNHVMKVTTVVEGHAVCRALAVGDHTEQGKTYEAAQIDNSVKTPLTEQLDGLGKWISWASYAIGVAIVAGRIWMYFLNMEFDWLQFTAYVLQSLMIAVTLIVVAVPEGLPMAVTLSLAYSMRSMLKTNNLVRKMHACETMGATTVICTDKTGTLTQNQMRVHDTQFYDPALINIIAEGMAVNATAELDLSDCNCEGLDEGHAPALPKVLGNPTEGALLLWLYDSGRDYKMMKLHAPVVKELSFSTERKYMATVVRTEIDGVPSTVLYVKGAPEIVLSLCRQTAGGVTKDVIDSQLRGYQSQAMRTLGFAYQIVNEGDKTIEDNRVVADNLTFLGVAAISDPVRQEVPAAVSECIRAGIGVKIITGDTIGTAKEIGRQIGLWNDQTDTDLNITTGADVAARSDEELRQCVEALKIIARARPIDKKRLVEALQHNGHVVAVTGDGTNDAPALRTAHVGLSMGDGTSVAKEASDITIIDNSFSSIGRAVMWGRSLYQNIQRFIIFQLTVNVTACLLVLCGAFMGTESPLTVTQMLWINLIMDTFAAMALASLPPSERVMHDKPRNRKAFILTRPMIENILGVGIFFFLLLLALLYVFQHADIRSMADLLALATGGLVTLGNAAAPVLTLGQKGEVTPYELTLLFTIFVMTHFFYLFNARAFNTKRSALHFKGCNGLLTISAIVFFGQVAMVQLPGLQQFFNVVGISLTDWVIIVVGSSLVLWVRELWSAVKSSR